MDHATACFLARLQRGRRDTSGREQCGDRTGNGCVLHAHKLDPQARRRGDEYEPARPTVRRWTLGRDGCGSKRATHTHTHAPAASPRHVPPGEMVPRRAGGEVQAQQALLDLSLSGALPRDSKDRIVTQQASIAKRGTRVLT
jgi:hypothetical protein